MKKTIEKIIAVTLCVVMMLGIAPLNGFVGIVSINTHAIDYNSFEEQCTDDGIYYKIVEPFGSTNRTITITGCNKTTVVNIPSKIGPYYVTVISGSAFSECTDLIEVTIPDSVITIGPYAFTSKKLKRVSIGKKVKEIKDYAFGSSKLTYVKFNGSLADWCNIDFGINANPAAHADSFYIKGELLTDITAESLSGLTKINDYAFQNLKSLKTLSFPECMMTIGKYAFSGCTGITDISFSRGITEIGEFAFSGCTGLVDLTIPDNISCVGNNAFGGCTSVSDISLPNSDILIGKEAFFDTAYYNDANNWINNALYIDDILIKVKTSVSDEFEIKEGILNIANSAFYGCKKITAITIPVSLRYIGEEVFRNCSKDLAINIKNGNAYFSFVGKCLINKEKKKLIIGFSDSIIPSDGCVEEISAYAFDSCSDLSEIRIPDSIISIGDYAFEDCPLERVYIGNGLETIPSTLIKSEYLNTIGIGSGVLNIPYSLFYNCSKLETVYYDAINCYCGYGWLSYCDSLKTIILGEHVEVITKGMFYGSSQLTEISVPDGVISIEESAFEGCTGLTSMIIPNSVVSVGNRAFAYCTNLKSIIIGNNVTNVGEGCFGGCTGLLSVTIGEKVESLPQYTFSSCENLKRIIIPGSVKKIESDCFEGCINLSDIDMPGELQKISPYAFTETEYYQNSSNWTDGVLYIGKSLISANKSLAGNYDIKEGTFCIATAAFYNCTFLTNVNIPDSVKYIGDNAFYKVNNICYHGTASGAGWGAYYLNGYVEGFLIFEDSSKNKIVGGFRKETDQIVIPDTVEIIGNGALSDCRMSSVFLPLSVTRIEKNAFPSITFTVYYEGSESDRNGITILEGNGTLTGGFCEWIYNCSVPQPNEFTLTYSANGGVGAPADYIGNGYISISAIKPTRDGYTFLGWSTSASANSAQYQPCTSFKLTANITLYAVWQENTVTPSTYTLTYNANGGRSAPASQTGSGNVTISYSAPTRNGYTFLGWAETAGAASAKYQTGDTINLTKNTTLYAVWKKIDTPSETDKPTGPDKPGASGNGVSKAKISAPTGTKQINWKYRVHLEASATNLPDGYHIAWYEGKTRVSNKADFTTEGLTSDHIYTAKIVDASGNVVSAASQEKTVKVEVKSDFFSKIISFFSRLFGSDIAEI